MSKHTPGPWEAGRLAGPDQWMVSGGPDGNRTSIADVSGEANARLIAAAPDLLRACKYVAEIAVAWDPLTPGDIAEVLAAVAKAEGPQGAAPGPPEKEGA